MGWLDTLPDEMLANLPSRPFAPNLIFGFDQVRRAVDIVEAAVEANKSATTAAGREAAMRAASDPSHSFIQNPVFAPAAAARWEAEMTFPLILRRSLFIAICSHVEHVLRRWCHMLHTEWSLARSLNSFPKDPKREPDIHHCLRYLRDEAGLDLGGFEDWPEWSHIDASRVARNRLTHDGGIIAADAERAKLATLPHIEVDESGLLMDEPTVHLLPGACEAAAENARLFFNRLTEVCRKDPRARG